MTESVDQMVMSLLVIVFSVPMFIFFAIQVYQLWNRDLTGGAGPRSGSRRTRHLRDLGPNLLNLGQISRVSRASMLLATKLPPTFPIQEGQRALLESFRKITWDTERISQFSNPVVPAAFQSRFL